MDIRTLTIDTNSLECALSIFSVQDPPAMVGGSSFLKQFGTNFMLGRLLFYSSRGTVIFRRLVMQSQAEQSISWIEL
jgi:hypothetical protein